MTLTDRQRLDRLERSVAQLASALRIAAGWRPEANGQNELAAITDEQRALIEAERERAAA